MMTNMTWGDGVAMRRRTQEEDDDDDHHHHHHHDCGLDQSDDERTAMALAPMMLMLCHTRNDDGNVKQRKAKP